MSDLEVIEIYFPPLAQTIELNTSEVESIEIQQALIIEQRSNDNLDWIIVSDNQPLQTLTNKGYYLSTTEICNVLLPINPQNKDTLQLYAGNSVQFIINKRTIEQIQYGDKATTLGITGQLANTAIGDHLKLMFFANKWLVLSGSQGNFHIN